MPRVRDVLDALESIAPSRFAFSFDKVGLQLGDPSAEVKSGIVSLDWSEGLVDAAIAAGAEIAVVHHPLIWNPLTGITSNTREGRIALRLIQNGIAFVACHTNWDSAKGGVNDALAARLGLQDVMPFGSAADVYRYKLIVFAPRELTPNIIDALSAAGAGVIGDYDRCAFWSEGTGTFVGGDSANPTVGESGRIEQVVEDRIEMVVPANRKSTVLRALLNIHSYEEPAYDLYPLDPNAEQPAGRMGTLESPMPLTDFASFVDSALGTRSLAWGASMTQVSKVAVVGGAADSEWRNAKAAGADVFVTGEVKQNVAVEASEAGLAILASGHYATEQPGMAALRDRLDQAGLGMKWSLYEPAPGSGGRPL